MRNTPRRISNTEVVFVGASDEAEKFNVNGLLDSLEVFVLYRTHYYSMQPEANTTMLLEKWLGYVCIDWN
jgi:hypothetical protein